jgi:hypothetical protein
VFGELGASRRASQNIKASIKHIAKCRMEMMGPRPMEVDRVSSSWADWSEEGGGEWDTELW